MCDATKGGDGNYAMSLTNMDPAAPWWATMFSRVPWEHEPSIASLLGFRLSMVIPDLLHVWNLGVAKEFLASALKILLQTRRVWGAGNLEGRMAEATNSLRAFAHEAKLHLRLKKITKTRIKWGNDVYPSLACSGYDAYIVGRWLERELDGNQAFPDIYTMLWASNRALSAMYSAGRFLSQPEKTMIKHYGYLFLNTYVRVAARALSEGKMVYKILPKHHMLAHLWSWDHRCANPAFYSTWLDEDFLKKIGHTLELTNQPHAQKRVLQRWLLALPRDIMVHIHGRSEHELSLP